MTRRSSMSLRRRLVLRVFVPVAILYTVVAAVGIQRIERDLVDAVDRSLVATASSAALTLEEVDVSELGVQDDRLDRERWAAIIDVASGETVSTITARRDGRELSPPDLAGTSTANLAGRLDTPFDAPSVDGSADYRAVATRVEGGFILVLAEPTEPVRELVGTLRTGAIVTGLGFLAAMAAVTTVAVRSGLRPLEGFVEATARVADGDLTERIGRAEGYGFDRIAIATNHMLDRIESRHDEQRIGRQRLNELMSNAAHELRTPLSVISGVVQMERAGMLTDDRERAKALDALEVHTGRMERVVEDLLAESRSENLRLSALGDADTIVALRDVVEREVERLREARPERVLRLRLPDDPAEIAGDESLTSLAVRHLVENAVGHTPVAAEIEVRVVLTDGTVRFTVADTGPGIPIDLQDQIFDRFVTGEESRARSNGHGAGLGLSIARSAIEGAGGSIALSSSPEGTVVTANWPRFVRSGAHSDEVRRDDRPR